MKSAVIQYFLMVVLAGFWSYFSGDDFIHVITLLLIVDIYFRPHRGE